MSHNVYNLDEAAKAESRKPIDASWSPAKKRVVAIACAALATSAVGYGSWAMLSRMPPGLPKTADDALAVINSAKFDRLDAERKQQYLEETMRLVRELPEEQRRTYWRDEKNREAFRKFMEERFDDAARRFARGEELPNMFPGGPPRGPRPEGEQAQRPQLTEEERAARMEQMRSEMNKRIGEQIKSGNAQSGGLRGEMMKRGGMGGGRGGWGGRGGGGGGGGAGGGGGGGQRGG